MDIVLLVQSTLPIILRQPTVTAFQDFTQVSMVFALENVELMKFMIATVSVSAFKDWEELVESALSALQVLNLLLMDPVALTVDPMKN